MKSNIKIGSLVVFLSIVFCLGFGSLKYYTFDREQQYIDHLENKSANSTLGLSKIPKNRIVDDSFVSHLPIIIIDTGEIEVINYNQYNDLTYSFETSEGINDSVKMEMSVIDNQDKINTLLNHKGSSLK